MEEKDAIAKERRNNSTRFRDLIKFYGEELAARPNLLKNNGNSILGKQPDLSFFDSPNPKGMQN